MMNIVQLRFVSTGLFLLLIFPSGLWLSSSGKPYSAILFNLHKLIGLALFIFLFVNIYRRNHAAPLSTMELTACFVAGLLFIATIVSGGLVSMDTPALAGGARETMPVSIAILHKLLPYLTLLAMTVSLFLLL